ncbi:MAG: tetratricopeptide repeat protein [Melioribacter sp.]|nr:tetratricopeptide repeat protein [Melioribacter sp.]
MGKDIKCTKCGEIIEPHFTYCPSCGSKLKKGKEVSETTLKNGQKNNTLTQQKNFPIVKLLYILAFLIVVGGIIIYSSGTFDKPIKDVSVNQMPNDEIHRGINLESIKQINALEEELKLNPHDKSKLLSLAHLLNDSGFKERAIEKYKEYLRLDPSNADVIVDMGVCYYELKNNEEALRLMKEALKYQPKHQIAHLNIGVVLLASGKREEAKQWWKKAVEINPENEIGKRAQELINSH